MSKYGFDEKELRKTIVTMIDKDGFNKKIVTYGKQPSGIISGDEYQAYINFIGHSEFYNESDELDHVVFKIVVAQLNPPQNTQYVGLLRFDTDEADWVLNIGDTVNEEIANSFDNPNPEDGLSIYSPIQMRVDQARLNSKDSTTGYVYYHVYAFDTDYKLVGRTKASAMIPEYGATSDP